MVSQYVLAGLHGILIYIKVAAIALLAYDYLLTLNREVGYFLSHRWRTKNIFVCADCYNMACAEHSWKTPILAGWLLLHFQIP
jgi:hypothetical protein